MRGRSGGSLHTGAPSQGQCPHLSPWASSAPGTDSSVGGGRGGGIAELGKTAESPLPEACTRLCSPTAGPPPLQAGWKDSCSGGVVPGPRAGTSSGWTVKTIHPANSTWGREAPEADWSSGQSLGSDGLLLSWVWPDL